MKKILLSILAASLLGSCTLDVTPESAVTFKNFFKTEQDYERVAYQINWNVTLILEDKPHEYAGVVADYMLSWSTVRHMKSHEYSRYISYSDWKRFYDIIYLSNVIIENASGAAGLDQNIINHYVGQAHFFKGLSYFYLSRRWGEAIITTDSENQQPYAKSPMIDVINESIESAEKAFGMVGTWEQVQAFPFKSKQTGNKGSVAALLANAYAWKASLIETYGIEGENRDKALEKSIYWATELIEKRAGSTYRLENNPYELCTIGLKGNIETNKSNESIFELETDLLKSYPTMYGMVCRPQYWPMYPNSSHEEHFYSVEFGVTPALVESIYEPDDLRLPAFFSDGRMAPGEESPEQWITPGPEIMMAFPRKIREVKTEMMWWGDVSFRTWNANTVIWRLADIILLRAECNAKLGNDALAVGDINEIRDRAEATRYPNGRDDTADVRLAVFKEREKELIFEGHRFYDCVRNGYLAEISPEYGALTDDDIQKGALFLVVGQGAFNRNTLMRQNRYWLQHEN